MVKIGPFDGYLDAAVDQCLVILIQADDGAVDETLGIAGKGQLVGGDCSAVDGNLPGEAESDEGLVIILSVFLLPLFLLYLKSY